MATQAYPSHSQTRQQLDELDALLQRMLALPSSPEPAIALAEPVEPEEFAPLPPTLPMTAVTRPMSSEANLQGWRMSSPVTAPPPLATAVEDTPLHQPAPYPYSMVYGQPLPAETPPPLEPWTPPPPPRATAVPYATPAWATEVTPTEESYPSALALPIVAVNRLFDLLTYLLGPLGGWLRRPTGRNTLGWLGILMIAAAIGWVALEWYGFDWTRLPFSLR